MSDEESKLKHSKRIKNTMNIIHKQVKIAKAHGVDIDAPHKLAKHHAMDCGNADCLMCDNPRHSQKHGKTKQEYSFEQTQEWIEADD